MNEIIFNTKQFVKALQDAGHDIPNNAPIWVSVCSQSPLTYQDKLLTQITVKYEDNRILFKECSPNDIVEFSECGIPNQYLVLSDDRYNAWNISSRQHTYINFNQKVIRLGTIFDWKKV